ncbi:penicillin-binding transpeptidase domain-containing protein (plasmid) [Priestia megaterium]|uniref:penicillin-binding protein PBP4(5) n=1 Tax=Priestia megaterium TaxID=1404 RepID=UPI000BF742CC|nr:penicillin-binding transpeptidase domain-containing protein [Priestia megaterium]MDH2449296.1 penicillin-binding transpeptidase domain-containing protein [Priestia megaterium]MDL5148754.1 penicillin-binding transpeptidase domain-containing protein [Priestia megaterium]PER70944.1 penicillin-binding protein [Priestia megaterium]
MWIKKKTKLLTIIGFTIVVLVSSIVYIYFTGNMRREYNNASAVVESFTEKLTTQNFNNLSEDISIDSLRNNNLTPEKYNEKYRNIFLGIHAKNIKVTDLNIKRHKPTGRYTFSYNLTMDTSLGKMKRQSYHGFLIKKNKEWKIQWKPNLIFPTMQQGDRVKFVTQVATRGKIIDRNGRNLAENGYVQEMGIIPRQLGLGKEREQAIHHISKEFSISKEDILKKLNQRWVMEDSFVPLKVLENNTLSNTSTVKEVVYSRKEVRIYSLNEAAAHLIGYVGKVSAEDIQRHPSYSEGEYIGKSGLEYTYDKELRGKNGGEIRIVNPQTGRETVLQSLSKKDGKDIRITIDAGLQQKTYDQLNGEIGASAIMNPQTGDLLALVSTPSYDPNLMTRGISSEQYAEYSENPSLPFLARYATRYAPGSTFKTITAAVGLETGVTKPGEKRQISGLEWKKDTSWGNYFVKRVHEVDQVDMIDALVHSDNIFFAQEALKIGKERFEKGVMKFGFNKDLSLPFSMKEAQVSNKGISSEVLLADSAYGQGEMLLSPIQQAMAYSPIANGGKLIYPKLINDQKTPISKRIIEKNTANTIKQALHEVVSRPDGTAHSLQIKGQSIAAKTGTAELKKKKGTDGIENGFLFAFDDKHSNYVVVSMIENVKGRGGSSYVVQKMKPVIESFYQK